MIFNKDFGGFMLENKNILLGVTGGIAAYKIATLASMLKKQKANVKVIMTGLQHLVIYKSPLKPCK